MTILVSSYRVNLYLYLYLYLYKISDYLVFCYRGELNLYLYKIHDYPRVLL